jgi:hypothetical protein
VSLRLRPVQRTRELDRLTTQPTISLRLPAPVTARNAVGATAGSPTSASRVRVRTLRSPLAVGAEYYAVFACGFGVVADFRVVVDEAVQADKCRCRDPRLAVRRTGEAASPPPGWNADRRAAAARAAAAAVKRCPRYLPRKRLAPRPQQTHRLTVRHELPAALRPCPASGFLRRAVSIRGHARRPGLHPVRLATAVRGHGPVHAQLGPSGLFYSTQLMTRDRSR